MPRPIENWQIWNEPNLEKFFAPRPSVHKYATLVRARARAIHSADHKANVILAGMSGEGIPPTRSSSTASIASDGSSVLRRGRGQPLRPDVTGVGAKIKRIRGVMRRHRDKRTALWITEIGWGSHPPDRFGLNKGVRGQKRILAKAFRMIVKHRRAWHVKRLISFDFRDPPSTGGGCSFCTSAGLIRARRQDEARLARLRSAFHALS